jgi:DNA-binding transcriptional LysR family regulator
MNLLHLKYFYEVARSRSFTETAKTLRISQPAISKMVRLLEDDIGKPLLERGKKGVRMTEDGELLFAAASKIFTEADKVSESLRSSDREFRGEWSVGVSDNIALYLAPKVIGRFKEKHPKLKLSIFAGTSGQIKAEMLKDRCRLGIFYTAPKTNEPFDFKQIDETEFWIVIAKKNPWLKTMKPKLADLKKAKVPRIESRHSDYSSGFPAHFHSYKLGLTDDAWIETNQHEVKKKLVLEGFGFALLTRHTVEQEVKEGKLLRVDCDQKLTAEIYAVWRRDQNLGRISEAFLHEWRP